MKNLFLPHFIGKLSKSTMLYLSIGQIFLFLFLAQINSNELVPKPIGVFDSMMTAILAKDFLDNFMSTIITIFKGMGLSVIIATVLVYLSIIPFFKNIISFISKLRYLTYTGLLFVFMIILKNTHEIKISLLLFGIIPYFVTSLLSYINDISHKEYELCISLKFNKWQTLYEVVIKGKAHTVLEVLRQNFAIAWMMVTSVEGICMSEGGLGTMMIKSNKYLRINDVFGVLLIILILGILFDYMFDVLKVFLFAYTDTERYSKLWIIIFLGWFNRVILP